MKSSSGALPTARGTSAGSRRTSQTTRHDSAAPGGDHFVRPLGLQLDVAVRGRRVDLDLRLAGRVRVARHDRERLHQQGIAVDVRQPTLAPVGEQLLVIGHRGGVVRIPGDAQRLAHGEVRGRKRATAGREQRQPAGRHARDLPGRELHRRLGLVVDVEVERHRAPRRRRRRTASRRRRPAPG